MLPREGFDGAAPHLSRGWAPVRMGTIGQGLGDVDAPHPVFAVEIGERAPDLQHAMVSIFSPGTFMFSVTKQFETGPMS